MTLNHATLIPTNHLPRTEFGQTILDDMDTSDAWWALREIPDEPEMVHGYRPAVVLAVITEDEPASTLVTMGLRDPDLYDEGRAYWLTDDAVVSVLIEEMRVLPHILSQDDRHVESMTSCVGWVRVHPSRYGIEVDSYYDHGNGLEAHDAHGAWDLARRAVLA